MNDAIDKFRDAIRIRGLEPPDVIQPGKLHRFPGIGKRLNNRAAWCLLLDDRLGGCYRDWSSGNSAIWQIKGCFIHVVGILRKPEVFKICECWATGCKLAVNEPVVLEI